MLADSTEYLYVPLTGPDTATLTQSALAVAVTEAGTGPTAWTAVDGYDATTGIVQFLVGPGTPIGRLTEGIHNVYLRVTSSPETVVVKATSGVTVTAY